MPRTCASANSSVRSGDVPVRRRLLPLRVAAPRCVAAAPSAVGRSRASLLGDLLVGVVVVQDGGP